MRCEAAPIVQPDAIPREEHLKGILRNYARFYCHKKLESRFARWRWWEIDATYWAIRLLQSLGLAARATLPLPSPPSIYPILRPTFSIDL
jgi:hypothetical protein